VLHYCVVNMPGAVPRTTTFALTNSTLPYTLKLANQGFLGAISNDPDSKPALTPSPATAFTRQLLKRKVWPTRRSMYWSKSPVH